MQWASANVLYEERYRTDTYNKSAFANRIFIVIYLFLLLVVDLSLTLDRPLDNHLFPKA